MPKTYAPLNLQHFTIVNSKATEKEVKNTFKNMFDWMKKEEELIYENKFDQIIEQYMNGDFKLEGSLQPTGRKLGIKGHAPTKQAYNMSEMLRTNVLSRVKVIAQVRVLENIIIENENIEMGEILNLYKTNYPHLSKVSYQFAKKVLDRIERLGVLSNNPTPSNILPLYNGDGHFVQLKKVKNEAFLTINLPELGKTTLKFIIPNKPRFSGGKLTKPSAYYNKKNGRLTFGFTVTKTVEEAKTGTAKLGVDLGRIEPFVATLATNETYSQPIFSNKRIATLSRKIERLIQLTNELWAKQILNEERAKEHEGIQQQLRQSKAEKLKTERLRVRNKISRLKRERAIHTALQIANIAELNNATIILENLAWIPNSKWEQGLVQEKIEETATKKRIRVRKTNAKNTSQRCSACKKIGIKHNQRTTTCPNCHKKLNRDTNASRNIATNQKTTSLTQLRLPATTGFSRLKTQTLYTTIQEKST